MMKKTFEVLRLKRIVVFLCVLLATVGAIAQDVEPVGKKERKKVVENIVEQYADWTTVSISGKLRMDMLPLSPSVKIFMERDTLIRISLRAPLVGEVGRAEIDRDSILVVNKMKKTYVKESISQFLSFYPGTLSDIQDIILGWIVVPSCGILSKDIWKNVEIYPEDNGGYSLFPNEKYAFEEFDYGYLVDPELRTNALAVMPKTQAGIVVGVRYEYKNKGYSLNVSYQSEKKTIAGTLDLDDPDWDAKGFDAIKINSNYRRMDFKQFMKSF